MKERDLSWWSGNPEKSGFNEKGPIEEDRRDKRKRFFAREIPKLCSLFGKSTNFSAKPEPCQILVAMNIISKLSFWIRKPTKQTKNSSDGFEEVIMDALAKFKRDGYVKKLKTSITSVPSDNQDLLVFLYNQIASIQANGVF